MVKQPVVVGLFLLFGSACTDGEDRWNKARMKVAAKASAGRHRFGDLAQPDSARMSAGRVLLQLDPEFLASRYQAHPVLIRRLIDEAIAGGDTNGLPLVARLFEASTGEQRIDFEVDLIAFGAAARPRLLEMLQRPDRSLVVRAADALAKTGATEAAGDIASLLQHEDSWIRMGAAHALGQLSAEAATAALLTALSDSSYAVVNAALVGLGRQQVAVAYEPALALLADARPEIRKHAAHTLGQIGNLGAIEVLQGVSKNDPDSGVRFMVGRALKVLEDTE